MSDLDSVRAALERHEAVTEDMQRRAAGGCCPSCVFGDEYTRAAEKVGRTRAWLIELLIKEARVSGWPKAEELVDEALSEFGELDTPRPMGLLRRIVLARARDACECRGECGVTHYNGPMCCARNGERVTRQVRHWDGTVRIATAPADAPSADVVVLRVVDARPGDHGWSARAHRALCQWCRPKDST